METLLVRTASELGYKPKLIYAATSNIPEFWDNLKEKAQWVIISLDYHTSLKFKEAQDFAQLYQAEYGKPPVGHYAALGFAACQMLEAAIKATNSLDNDIIREWLINNKVNTCVGTWEVDKDLMNKGVKYVPKYFHFVTQWQNGTMQIVYPPELATSSYIYPIP
jgi:ABC-type branched-subunit amino acid transport system substrate-binding protein